MVLLQSLTDQSDLIHASEQMSVYVLFILLQVPTVDSMEYSVVNSTAGLFRYLVSSIAEHNYGTD